MKRDMGLQQQMLLVLNIVTHKLLTTHYSVGQLVQQSFCNLKLGKENWMFSVNSKDDNG